MKYVKYLLAVCLVGSTISMSVADKVELNPIADVTITTFGGGEGGNVFMKFSLAGLPAATVDSAFLEVYVWEADTGWDGDLSVVNVHNQTWDESTPDTVLWIYTTSGSTVALGFGDTLLGWTRSTDIGQVVQPEQWAQSAPFQGDVGLSA